MSEIERAFRERDAALAEVQRLAMLLGIADQQLANFIAIASGAMQTLKEASPIIRQTSAVSADGIDDMLARWRKLITDMNADAAAARIQNAPTSAATN